MCEDCTENKVYLSTQPVLNAAGKMDSAIKAVWVWAIRSGEFQQVRSQLRDLGNGRCCLGVLCDVVSTVKGFGRWREGTDFITDPERVDPEVGIPQVSVFETAGFDVGGYEQFVRTVVLPFRNRQGQKVDLAGLNDSGMPFDQIADLIQFFL